MEKKILLLSSFTFVSRQLEELNKLLEEKKDDVARLKAERDAMEASCAR